jgi:hypothetical protein
VSKEDLVTKVLHLRSLMSARATQDVYKYTVEDYPEIRDDLLADPRFKNLVPQVVRRCRDLNDFWQFIRMEYGTYAERRAFIREQFEPLLTALEDESLGSPSDEAHSSILSKVNSAHVQATWQRALERRSSDPEGAITSWGRRGRRQVGPAEVYAKAAELMNLSPGQHDEQVFRQLLGGCQTVVNGLATLRNRLGDAHGKGKRVVRPAPRHAELGVNLAGAMAVFLIRTWEERAKVTRPIS